MEPVVIVGAGLAGLACAVDLHEAGRPIVVLEASNGVGGRVRTDKVGGFLLDRGFQVYLDAYPAAGAMLDLEALELKSFEPGALVFDGKKLHRVMDVFRRPNALVASAVSPVGSLLDKLRVAFLRWKVGRLRCDEIMTRPDTSTEDYLKKAGFSKRMIDVFFRSFYGGIFLERDLRTSSRMFEFTFKMFSEGSATVPMGGMGEISKQLETRLPEDAVRLSTPVRSVEADRVILESGDVMSASRVLVATDATTALRLTGTTGSDEPKWRSVTNLYFEAGQSPLDEPIIALNGTGRGLVNNVAVMSDVAGGYAPAGKSLVSVALLGLHPGDEIPTKVQQELSAWFGDRVKDWRHLRTDLIEKALPEQLRTEPVGVRELDGILVCGDHAVSASIEGAISSGRLTAGLILKS